MTLNKDDLLYFFFSGHGRSSFYDSTDVYFMTYDSQKEDIYDGISYKWLISKLDKSKVEHAVFFIDACKSGVLGVNGKGDDERNNINLLDEIRGLGENKIIFSSGRNEQSSYEFKELKNGVFTHFLIKALEGKCKDKDEDNFVDLVEAEEYIYNNVKKYTAKNKKVLLEPTIREINGLLKNEFPLSIRR